MRRQVWKFPLEFIDPAQPVTVSEYSRVVHVGMQANKVCFWIEVTHLGP
jgi:hypothetical protein